MLYGKMSRVGVIAINTDRKALEDALRIFAEDARDRISRRAAADGDCPKTRAFAREVMRPIALAAEMGGAEFDMDAEIEDELGRSTWDE